MAYLIVIEGGARGAMFPLQLVPTPIGRAEDCPIQLRDERVSREHAVIAWGEGGYTIADRSSRNGIRVNGLPVGEALLRPGDEIKIGGSVLLFLDDASPPVPGTIARRPTVAEAAAEANTSSSSSSASGLPAVRSTPLVGESPAMAEVYRRVAIGAGNDLPVLILGESGTGKELVARSLHVNSVRRDHPFVPVNCANLTPTLLESELFGHEKGSFTGAEERKMGLFEAAGEGTIFLDEIGEMAAGLQARLLRVLAEKEFARVGSHVPIAARARIVAATHRDLVLAIEEGQFREDLYYRLNVLPIELPPLRDRQADIPLLLEHFLDRCRASCPTRLEGFDPAVLDVLTGYRWPGNVRELSNFVERMSILCSGQTVGLDDLPPEIRGGAPRRRGGPVQTLIEAERDCLLRALDAAEGNKTQAAGLLGIERSTLYSKLKRHELG